MIPYPCTLVGGKCVEPYPNGDFFGKCSRTAGVGLSNNQLTANAVVVTSAVIGNGARVLKGNNTGKIYFEFTVGSAGSVAGNPMQFGLCTAAATLGTDPTDAAFIENTGAEMQCACNGTAHGLSGVLVGMKPTNTIGIAIDFGGKLFWAIDYDTTGNAIGRQWNLALNGNPATGSNGIDVSVLSSATLYPFIGIRGSLSGGSAGTMGTFNPTSSVIHAAPSGFTAGW
jgi:hypothetical protein